MENKLPKNFFTKERKTKVVQKDDYSKIESINWKKEILQGKSKVIGSLPNDKKMI